MSDKNAEVEAYILSSLPATFSSLWQTKESEGVDWYREVDKGLQRLRKRGAIQFRREGRATIWEIAP